MTPLALPRLGTAGLATSPQRFKPAREQLTPQQAWVMSNTRSFKGKLETSPGQSTYLSQTVSGRPSRVYEFELSDTTHRLAVLTNTKIYGINRATGLLVEITWATGNYTASATEHWDVTAFKDLMIATNGRDVPQKWDGSTGLCVALGGTPPLGRTVAAFLNYVVFGSTWADGNLVQWSDNGGGEVYSGGDAGSFRLYQGSGYLRKLLGLGEALMAYRSSSIHTIFYVGSPFVLGQRQVNSSHGLIAPRAVIDIGGRHVYWGEDNFYVTDGATFTPIGSGVIDDAMDGVDPGFLDQIHTAVDLASHEVYWFYPDLTSAGLTMNAWVWNWETGAWRKEIVTAQAAGLYHKSSQATWATAVGTWAAQTTTWNSYVFLQALPALILATNAGAINSVDATVVDAVGVARTRTFESGLFSAADSLADQRLGFVAGGLAELVRLDFDQENKGSYNVTIEIGTQDTLRGDAAITWTTFTLPATGATRSLFPRLVARYFAVRIQTTGLSQPFRASGAVLWFNPAGDR